MILPVVFFESLAKFSGTFFFVLFLSLSYVFVSKQVHLYCLCVFIHINFQMT